MDQVREDDDPRSLPNLSTFHRVVHHRVSGREPDELVPYILGLVCLVFGAIIATTGILVGIGGHCHLWDPCRNGVAPDARVGYIVWRYRRRGNKYSVKFRCRYRGTLGRMTPVVLILLGRMS